MKRLRVKRRHSAPPRPTRPQPPSAAALGNPYAPYYRPARSFAQLTRGGREKPEQ